MKDDISPEDKETLLIQHFLAKAIKRPNGCIEWMGAITDYGKGAIGDTLLASMYGTRSADQIAWLLSGREKPAGYSQIVMKCRLVTCINPEHMKWIKR